MASGPALGSAIYQLVLVLDLNELDVEVERLARQLVVGVKHDLAVLGRPDGHRHGTVAHEDIELLAHLGMHHHGGVGLAVGVLGLEVHIAHLADLHVLNGLVEAGNHLTGHARELDGLVAVARTVELRAVVKRAGVVDFDLLALVAHGSPLICRAAHLRPRYGQNQASIPQRQDLSHYAHQFSRTIKRPFQCRAGVSALGTGVTYWFLVIQEALFLHAALADKANSRSLAWAAVS